MNEASAVELARFLEQESSQVVAVVFSRLDPTVAAEVLKRLPETLQVDVVQRLKSLDEISEEVTREIEESLQVWFADQMRRSQRRNAGQKAVQQILNIAGHKTRRRIEQRVHAAVPRPTEPPAKRTTDSHVAPLACSFQTVLEMDDGALSQVFSAADPRDAVLALAGSERQFIDRVLRNLKPRDADRLRKAFQGLDASQLNDVAGSQQKIAELAGTMRKKNRRAASASSPVASA
ncbi:MAG: hypothetical protein GTO76_05525 [Planctomycetales bacterium]|nr:hypothetical protein [Planctomycetales bacterium]NIN08118.1 hypothetical protein [Planctomycetales bacterium]NIN77243.1 hypothetical protein [Planctomycetales bacterium]NIO34432.1 hypothetical protein [Planctomycetales bacterium]NIP04296.1 hypothetical protein [Planctomycetales bacterium]